MSRVILLSMIKRSLFVLISILWCVNSAPARATPILPATPTRSTTTAVDLQSAIDRFFKTGMLEENWFALKESGTSGKFDEFRQQALDARNIALTLYGPYQSVRSQSNTSYIVALERSQLRIEFQLDLLGRITAVSAK